jgi:pyruvate dehydrogenase E2 component (dihydrolipoamide acetyltransferase)
VPTDVIMPALGMAQETGTLLQWLRSEGETIAKGEPLMEIETDKVTVEIEAPASGVLRSVRATPGDEIPVGEVIAVILAEGESAPAASIADPRPVADSASGDGAEAVVSAPAAATAPHARGRKGLASPKARRMAAELGIDLSTVHGSGPGGAVVAADVESLVDATVAAPRRAAEELEPAPAPVSSLWRTMAERMVASWTSVPHFYLVREVDASRLLSWRSAIADSTEGVTYTDLLVRLTAASLREHPRVNVSWLDESLRVHDVISIGVAVAVDDGLVVPVIHGVEGLSIAEIAARRADLVDRARTGRLRLEDVQGGTFTLSNLGMFGIDAFSAIVPPPQAAILAVGRIAERVVPVGGEPAVRPMLVLTLSCDHRAVDGARAAAFLDRLAGLIEEPAALIV